MGDYQNIIEMIALTMGVGWASGVNLYAAVLMLGYMGMTGNIDLPPGLEIVENPLVMLGAGLMYVIEFFADKTPGVDTAWDTLHTFIRIPAGAIMAMGAVGDTSSASELAAALVGGGLATASHAAKAGTRVMINTSPEPFSNWAASITEDVGVIAGLWTALNHPVLFLVLLALFILLLIWLLPRLWRAIKYVFRKLARLFGGGEDATPPPGFQGAGSGGKPPAPPPD